MITSKQQEFSDAQAILSTVQISTNVIDLGAPGTVLGAPTALTRDIGPGNPIPIVIQVATAFAGAGSLTVDIQVANTISLVGATTLASFSATATQLPLGKQVPVAVVPNDADQRYLGISYSRSTSTLTGSLDAAIVAGVQTNTAAGRNN